MASEDPMNNTGGTEEETIAMRRKRLRRVSFADREITSVHIFKRDEDYETPPNSSASKPQAADTSESEDKVLRFFDSEDTEDDEKSFLRPKSSPSSGGSTIGSATSDDEENFFGPVSSHFINPGRLSDTSISEDRHDFTMDSSAFSMHYRSIAMSESGDLRTPTSTHATSTSDAMLLTHPKKLFPKSPLPLDTDSSDMSLVGEDSRKYDYGHIPPSLAALLADELPPSGQDSHCLIDTTHAAQTLSPYDYAKEASLSSSTMVGIVPQSLPCVTPSPRQGGSFMSRETLALVESLSTIQKSKSRFGFLPSSPASALSKRIEISKLHMSGYRSITTPSTLGREEIIVRQEKHADIPIANLEELLSEHDSRTPVSEYKSMLDQHRCGTLSPVVDIGDELACISLEEYTNPEIENSLLNQQDRNQTASTSEKVVSFLANSPDPTMSALKNCITLQDHELKSKAICRSETGDGNVPKHCASDCSMNIFSENVDSLLAESSVLLSETGFLNGSAQQREKDSVLNKSNNISVAHCETEVMSTEDFPAVVTENLLDTSASSSMDKNKNEALHAKGPSRLRRKAKEVGCAVRSCSPKIRKSTHYISNPVMDHPDENYNAIDCPVVREQVINWVEIPGKVSVEINHLLAPLADKLNSRLISELEDILAHLKKVHLCEMFCLQVKSQKVCDDLSGAKTKRYAESRLSLCKLAYEKAKLKLMHLKQEIMMKKFQTVSTDVRTSEILRLSCVKLLHQRDFRSTGLLNREQALEVTTNKGAEITQAIRILDSKVKNLITCFPTCDKLAGERTYADTIMIAEENLKKKMSYRFIRQDILVWKVDSLSQRNDCQSIVLNYSGLINQRLTLKPGHASCVLISNSLSDTFTKQFPDMNVSTALNSLFDAECSQEYSGSSTLLEITQRTSLVVHNLLDVAEELQLARMEITNLVQGNFDSPSAEQLHLQVAFIDSKSLRKVIMILDVACLIHGKYPGDIIPCEIVEVLGTKRDAIVWKQLKKEIESAIDDVEVGYPRVLRLCGSISKLLQSESKKFLVA